MADKKYTKSMLSKKTVKELHALAVDDEGLDPDDLTELNKSELIDVLLEIEVADDEEELDDELEEDDEELDEEEPEVEEDEVDEEPAPKATKKSKAAAKDDSTLAAKQVATLLGTEAKTLRQFFRSSASTIEPVGSGGRYEFNESDVPQIKKEFDAWKAGHGSRGTKRGEGSTTRSRGKRGPKIAEITEVEEVEELEVEELEDDELDDEELELEDED